MLNETRARAPRDFLAGSSFQQILLGWFGAAWQWFSAFRRTRPFWAGLWMIVGGWFILRLSLISVSVVMSAGLTGFGGWLSGGGLILCGLVTWAAPSQRYVSGLIGLLLAIVSIVISNLGGFGLGLLFGIVGGSMALAWGPKRVRKPSLVPVSTERTE